MRKKALKERTRIDHEKEYKLVNEDVHILRRRMSKKAKTGKEAIIK
jgi:hypothetical protein